MTARRKAASKPPMHEFPAVPTEADLEINTPRLSLRTVLRSHAGALFPVLSDHELYKFTGEPPPESVAALRDLYAFREKRLSPDGDELWLNWVVQTKAAGEAIGYVQATVARTHADIAWLIGLRWQRCGYGSEAAKGLVRWLREHGVGIIRAKIHPKHAASARVAGSAGLQRTDKLSDGEEVWVLGSV